MSHQGQQVPILAGHLGADKDPQERVSRPAPHQTRGRNYRQEPEHPHGFGNTGTMFRSRK